MKSIVCRDGELFYYWVFLVENKPVLRGHLQGKEKWSSEIGDLLKEAKFIWKFLLLDMKKGDL